MVETAVNATVCMSRIFTEKEFLAFLSSYNKPHPADRLPSGASELLKSLQIIKEKKRTAIIAQPDRRLLKIQEPNPIEVWSLSPSDRCLERFMTYVAANMPQKGQTKTRAPAIKANETAVALLVKLGNHSVLLGADLEETHQGWSAILASAGRPSDKSTLFKVPHHGSVNGHHPGVWDTMLTQNPVAILTPYNKSSKLPTSEDAKRLKSYSDKCFTTQPNSAPKPISRPSHIEKTIRQAGIKLTPVNNNVGHIRAKTSQESDDWLIELNNGAAALV